MNIRKISSGIYKWSGDINLDIDNILIAVAYKFKIDENRLLIRKDQMRSTNTLLIHNDPSIIIEIQENVSRINFYKMSSILKDIPDHNNGWNIDESIYIKPIDSDFYEIQISRDNNLLGFLSILNNGLKEIYENCF